MIKKLTTILSIAFFAATAISFASESEGDSLWPVPDYSGNLLKPRGLEYSFRYALLKFK
jgi:hypothetical protein